MLALGGGGARGFAHIGVLDTLARHQVPLRAVVGTSMGAVIAAMFLAHGSIDRVRALWREALDRRLLPEVRPLGATTAPRLDNPLLQLFRTIRSRLVMSVVVNRTTVLSGEVASRAMELLVPELTIEELQPPLVVVASDLASGAEVRLARGPLRLALQASSAIPGVLPAVRVGERLLVDGGAVAEVPVAAARAIGWPVVAVDVGMDLPGLEPQLLVLDTMMRANQMTAGQLRAHHLRRAQEVIRPAVGHALWSDWQRFDELVDAGRAAACRWLGVA